MEVLLINNPLKQVHFTGSYVAKFGRVQSKGLNKFVEEKDFRVNLIPHYMDIQKGVWNVTLDSYMYQCKTSSAYENTVLDISTSLVTSYITDVKTGCVKSRPASLGRIYITRTAPNQAMGCHGGSFEKKWFTIEQQQESFQVTIKQHEFCVVPLDILEIDFEISFLFQRIK